MIAIRELAETGITVIEPGQRVTLETVGEFENALEAAAAVPLPMIILNMERTRVVDSSGVGAFVQAMKNIKRAGGRFVLASLQPDVRRAFHLMNLYQVFDIFETEELARKHLLAGRT